MSGRPVELSPGQLRKLAELIHRQEVQKLNELPFDSYAEQQTYLRDAKDARDMAYHIIDSTQEMVTENEAEKDETKQDISKDIYEYCTKGIQTALEFIRSCSTRKTYLEKLKSHSDDLIKQLKWLDPITQQKEAQRLALEAITYKKTMLEYSEKFQHFIPNQFSRWLKENNITFEDLVKRNTAKLGYNKPFKNLDNIQKLRVYESIIEDAGQGKSVVNFSSNALGKVGVAFLVFTAAVMVWDIFTAEDKLEAAIRNAVSALSEVVTLTITKVANVAIQAGLRAANIKLASAAVSVIGAVAGFGIGVVVGIAAGAMLDLIFNNGEVVDITEGLTPCRVAPMPDGLELARLIKHNYPDL